MTTNSNIDISFGSQNHPFGSPLSQQTGGFGLPCEYACFEDLNPPQNPITYNGSFCQSPPRSRLYPLSPLAFQSPPPNVTPHVPLTANPIIFTEARGGADIEQANALLESMYKKLLQREYQKNHVKLGKDWCQGGTKK